MEEDQLTLEEMMRIAEKAAVWDGEQILLDEEDSICFTCRGFYDGLEIDATEYRYPQDNGSRAWTISVKDKTNGGMELGYLEAQEPIHSYDMISHEDMDLISTMRRSYELIRERVFNRVHPKMDENIRKKRLADIRDKLKR